MKIIEQDTIDIIKAHINERPRYKLAQRMGVSVKFLYKILHDCNCKIEHKRPVPKPNKKRDEQIAKLYTNHSVKEIAEIIGCHPSTVGKAAKRLKLTHSNETIERLKKNSLANLKKAYEKATISKRVKSWQRTMLSYGMALSVDIIEDFLISLTWRADLGFFHLPSYKITRI